jgi:chromosome segregation ATPase
MEFDEKELWIQVKPSISTIPPKKRELFEHFEESDYENIQKKIQALKEKQESLNQQIEERKKNASTMESKKSEYETFYHMLENGEERNQSYVKTLLFLITLIILLLLLILFYFKFFQ